MTASRAFTIRTSIWVAVAMTVASTLLGTGALYAYQLSRAGHRLEQSRAQSIAEVYAAALEPLLSEGSAEAISEYAKQVHWHPSVCLLAVLGPDGNLLASRGNKLLLDSFLASPIIQDAPLRRGVWHIAGDDSRAVPPLLLACVPIGMTETHKAFGALVCGLRPTPTHVSGERSWRFFGGLIFIAAAGFLLGSSFLRMCIVAPLAHLTAQAVQDGEFAPGDLHTNRKDEIGGLTKLLTHLRGDATEWRQRTLSLHRNMNQRVNSETAKIHRQLQQAERQIWSDALTGLGNRRLLDDKLDDIYRVQQKAGEDLCIAMIDVDNFKKLNDSLGHQAGDDLLKFIGELLRQTLREGDLAIRFGGDEFALILPGVTAANARSIGERTVRLFAQHSSLLPVPSKPGMSIGVASMLQNRSASAQDLLHLADTALYEAKKQGKGQVSVCPSSPASKSHT